MEGGCPECGKETYDAECSNMSCDLCGCLFEYCEYCGWTDHEECICGD